MRNIVFIMILFVMLFTIFIVNISDKKLKENDVLYNRFKVEQIIHKRLIVVEDINTRVKYWMIHDLTWLISANYIEKGQ